MSFTKDRGQFVFQCDSCHDTVETECVDFQEAKTVIEKEGWLIRRQRNGAWVHYCKGCDSD